MYNRRLSFFSRSPSLDQTAQRLKAKRDFSMRLDSSKHNIDMDVDAPKSTLNIFKKS